MNPMLDPTSIESLTTASYFLFDELRSEDIDAAGHDTSGIQTAASTSSGAGLAGTPVSNPLPSTRYSTPTTRWTALTTRDSDASDAFIYAVRTTGIYCRPDCSARLARRANVEFFDTPDQALKAGYRPCKRCKPGRGSPSVTSCSTPHETEKTGSVDPPVTVETSRQRPDPDDIRFKIHQTAELVRHAAMQGKQLSLSQLSKEVGLSKWHLQRVFKKLQGMTPREMAENLQRRGSDSHVTDRNVKSHDLPELEFSNDIDLGASFTFDTNNHASSEPLRQLSPQSTETTGSACTPSSWSDDNVFNNQFNSPASGRPCALEPDVEMLLSELFPELASNNADIPPKHVQQALTPPSVQ
ncbi:hypothetical protein PV10_03174 [Exophiala mesophila]|uniref:HTH araC/xylS-type domain-containing protein n=1 Tax=Exophiala mesophila TaxID=212818 RepID=A0A0D2A9B7_EXOME|nr:uncharacterized protein PV10_03174 [Exophiala mesophila]KIV95533.1 hypothetical protein PV10_03174 [Exophiala mesophila]